MGIALSRIGLSHPIGMRESTQSTRRTQAARSAQYELSTNSTICGVGEEET